MDRRTYFRIIITLGFLIGLNPFSIDMYLPGFTSIAASLKTDVATVGLSLASFFAGICLGQLVYGPVMDRFGRKKPLLIGLSIYLIASIGCAFVTTVEQLIFLRFVQALGGCAGMVASRAMVRDIFPANENAKVFSLLILVMGIAPIIAPSIGGLVVTTLDWHAIFVLLALITAAIMFSVWKFLPESRGSDSSVSLHPFKVLVGYVQVSQNLKFILYTFAMAFATAALFGYITSSPFIFMELYGLSEFQYSAAFSLCAMCLIGGSQINRLLLRKMTEAGVALRSCILFVIISLILAVAMSVSVAPLALVLVCIGAFMFLLGILNPNTSALAITSVSHNIGMASALTGFVQMGLSAIMAAAVSSFTDGTARPMAISIFACAAISLICIVFAGGITAVKNGSEKAAMSNA